MPSKIEWTNETWNPTTGCTKVSPGCAHCYAETLTKRYAGSKGWPAEFKPWTPANADENVVLHPDRLEAPFSWRTPRRVFVNSMSDLFHENIPDEFIDRAFAVMLQTPQHQYQLLTKRPERMRDYVAKRLPSSRWLDAAAYYGYGVKTWSPTAFISKPLPNVWLGVTVENQRWANIRIPQLMSTPAAVRFVSYEPALGPVDFTRLNLGKGPGQLADFDQYLDVMRGQHVDGMGFGRDLKKGIDWIIIGGESGPHFRPFDPQWARDVIKQAKWSNVACFVKQLGGARPGTNLEDLPEDLRVREYPA